MNEAGKRARLDAEAAKVAGAGAEEAQDFYRDWSRRIELHGGVNNADAATTDDRLEDAATDVLADGGLEDEWVARLIDVRSVFPVGIPAVFSPVFGPVFGTVFGPVFGPVFRMVRHLPRLGIGKDGDEVAQLTTAPRIARFKIAKEEFAGLGIEREGLVEQVFERRGGAVPRGRDYPCGGRGDQAGLVIRKLVRFAHRWKTLAG